MLAMFCCPLFILPECVNTVHIVVTSSVFLGHMTNYHESYCITMVTHRGHCVSVELQTLVGVPP